MKRSRRLIRNTIVALHVAMALYVGVYRLYVADGASHSAAPAATAD
jgi:hypothetical protein